MNEKIVKYLERIGYSGDLSLNAGLLASIQELHVKTVPYENLDVLAGVPISLAPDALYEKIIIRKRGGFCFELNALYSWFLSELGFSVTNYFARYLMNSDVIPKRRHHVIIVEIEGKKILCDVGVGNEAPRRTLVLELDTVQSDGFGEYKFEYDDFLGWILLQNYKGQWRRQYSFTEDPQIPSDFEAISFYCEKHPLSIFNKQRIVAIKTSGGRKTLDGNIFKIFDGGSVEVTEAQNDAQIRELLMEYFGISLS